MAEQAQTLERSRVTGWVTTNSTPDRLRLMALLSVLVIVSVGLVAWLLTDRLVNQTTEVAGSTGEVLIATQQVSASFAEADAAAVSVHLAGADGNREQRRLYEEAIDRATSSLEQVARLVGDDDQSHNALQDIAANTTEYAGLIETARLSSVQDISGADDTLRQASALNRNEISPDVELISDLARKRFDSQTSSSWYVVAIILLVVALAVLLVGQIMLHRRFRRLINLPLALATIVTILLVILSARGFGAQQRALNAAEDDAFNAIQVSEQIQQAAYRHRAIGTASILSGNDALDELSELEAALTGGSSTLLGQAVSEASSLRESASATEVQVRWDRYQEQSQLAQRELLEGSVAEAEAITQGDANAAFNGFNTSVEAALLDNREEFLGQLDLASDSLRWLRGLIGTGSLLAAVLTWWGFALRIGEYR